MRVGYSAWLRVDGHRVVLSTLDGLTDGTPPGTVHYTVRYPASVRGGRRVRTGVPLRRGRLRRRPGAAGLRPAPPAGWPWPRATRAVRQALFLLLSTTPGERLMRPGYGSRLHRLVFAPNDDTTAGLAIHYVRQAIAAGSPGSR